MIHRAERKEQHEAKTRRPRNQVEHTTNAATDGDEQSIGGDPELRAPWDSSYIPGVHWAESPGCASADALAGFLGLRPRLDLSGKTHSNLRCVHCLQEAAVSAFLK